MSALMLCGFEKMFLMICLIDYVQLQLVTQQGCQGLCLIIKDSADKRVESD